MKEFTRKATLWFFLLLLAFVVIASIHQTATAGGDDKVLASLEEAYNAAANHANLTHELTVQAQNNEREALTQACLDWKSLAYYKEANNIPMVNNLSLSEIDNVNCNAVGF